MVVDSGYLISIFLELMLYSLVALLNPEDVWMLEWDFITYTIFLLEDTVFLKPSVLAKMFEFIKWPFLLRELELMIIFYYGIIINQLKSEANFLAWWRKAAILSLMVEVVWLVTRISKWFNTILSLASSFFSCIIVLFNRTLLFHSLLEFLKGDNVCFRLALAVLSWTISNTYQNAYALLRHLLFLVLNSSL